MLQLRKKHAPQQRGSHLDMDGTLAAERASLSTGKREVRCIKRGAEVRAESGDGKVCLVGYTALYNSLSQNLGTEARPWKERIMPHAFARALAENQDVRHLINHDRNLVLGRTKSGTLNLEEDATGLRYRTLLPDTSYARDLAASVERGDIDEQSFSFVCSKESWVVENGIDIRQLEELSILSDISTVTYPAYFGTSAGVEARMFPDGVPESIAAHLKPKADGDESGVCMCDCTACAEGNCADCSNLLCDDENCADCPMQMSAKAKPAEPTPASMAAAAIVKSVRDGAAQDLRPSFRAALQEDGTLELLVYEDIGENWWTGGGITAKGIKQQIDAAGPTCKSIRMRINSFGGDAFEGIAIHNMIRAQGKPVEVCIDGLAASAASVVAMCGDTITMYPSSMMMVHNASTIVYGYAKDMRQTADVLDKISSSICQAYAARTGKTAEYCQGLMDAESWMSADDCLKDGFATAIKTPEPDDPDAPDPDEMVDMARMSPRVQAYRNLPEHLKAEKREQRLAEERDKKDANILAYDPWNDRKAVQEILAGNPSLEGLEIRYTEEILASLSTRLPALNSTRAKYGLKPIVNWRDRDTEERERIEIRRRRAAASISL